MEDVVSKYKIIVTISRIPRIYKLFRMTKLLRTYKSANQTDTVISNLISKMIKSKHFIYKILPLYVLILLIAHIFTCIWYYISDTDEPIGWINQSGFREEPLADRYWVSLYFVYTTLTTTGYGDIVPGTKWEYAWTIIFMGVGVTVHSMIYTYMLSMFEDMNNAYEEFSIKKDLLLDLKKEGIFKNDKKLYLEMLVLVDKHTEYRTQLIASKTRFERIDPIKRNTIIKEICLTKHRFDKLKFFEGISTKYWVPFYDRMERKVYLKDTPIFEKGAGSKEFFVIRRGSVYFTYLDPDKKLIPFMEVDSYFGEFELFETKMSRQWTVMAKTNLVLFSLKKHDFLEYFGKNFQMRSDFIKSTNERLSYFRKTEREILRSIRRTQRVKEKIDGIKQDAKETIKKEI